MVIIILFTNGKTLHKKTFVAVGTTANLTQMHMHTYLSVYTYVHMTIACLFALYENSQILR